VSAPAANRSRTAIAAVSGIATTYAAITTFFLVFYIASRATQSVAGVTVANLVSDAPLWIWLAAMSAAGVVATVVATLRAAVMCNDCSPR